MSATPSHEYHEGAPRRLTDLIVHSNATSNTGRANGISTDEIRSFQTEPTAIALIFVSKPADSIPHYLPIWVHMLLHIDFGISHLVTGLDHTALGTIFGCLYTWLNKWISDTQHMH
jgi:hypothetical protein